MWPRAALQSQVIFNPFHRLCQRPGRKRSVWRRCDRFKELHRKRR